MKHPRIAITALSLSAAGFAGLAVPVGALAGVEAWAARSQP